MSRRYTRRNRKQDTNAAFFLAAIAIIVLLIKIVLVLLALFLVGLILKWYYEWHQQKLAFYNNDPKAFWHKELKFILANIWATLLTFCGLILFFSRFWSGFVLVCIGLLFYPAVQRRIAGRLGPRPRRNRNMIIGVLTVLLFVVNHPYEQRSQILIKQQQLIEAQKQEKEIKRQQLVVQQLEQSRLYADSALKLSGQGKYQQALVLIDSSILLSPGNEAAWYAKASIHNELKQYDEVILALNNMASISPEGRMLRARCFIKTGQPQSAIPDLKIIAESGNAEAERLYDKVNPIIREITGYITRCCDGSISYSSGRGTCSHHGGVCDWNEPVYEEHRKYQDE